MSDDIELIWAVQPKKAILGSYEVYFFEALQTVVKVWGVRAVIFIAH